MLVYATQQNMVDRFGTEDLVALTNRAGTDTIDVVVLERALNDADSEIDTYLVGRYALPLSSPPAVLSRIASDIAYYRLWDKRTNEEARQRYDDAVKFLENVAKGVTRLGPDVNQAPAAIGGGPTSSSPGRQFTATTLKDF